jgi:hypothetical protein
MRKTPIRVTLDPDILAWLQDEAKRRRVSMSHIIREALLREMPKEEK